MARHGGEMPSISHGVKARGSALGRSYSITMFLTYKVVYIMSSRIWFDYVQAEQL